MQFENPPQREAFDPEREQPLRELAILLGGVLALGAIAALALAFLAGQIAPALPFSLEQKFVASRFTPDPRFEVQSKHLQQIADRLAATLPLPANMKLTLHYSDESTVNAYATLGGHIVVFRGLIAKVDSENALAAVLAHEIAHVYHRHPAAAAGRGIAVGLVLSAISSTIGDSIAQRILGASGTVVLLSYSREQETVADDDALRAVATAYGHLGGAADLFETLRKAAPASTGGFEFLKTHPQADRRIEHVRQFARERGIAADGPLTRLVFPLPESGERKLPSGSRS